MSSFGTANHIIKFPKMSISVHMERCRKLIYKADGTDFLSCVTHGSTCKAVSEKLNRWIDSYGSRLLVGPLVPKSFSLYMKIFNTSQDHTINMGHGGEAFFLLADRIYCLLLLLMVGSCFIFRKLTSGVSCFKVEAGPS